ncbi:Hypothetical protein A7982_04448 [Minicystis rosea]|nr:Hypothetical protein A7982_04448 [Minicystis rosea]
MPNPFEPIVFSPRLLAVGTLFCFALGGCAESDEVTANSTVAEAPSAARKAPSVATFPSFDGASSKRGMGGSLFSGPQPWTKDVSDQQKSAASDDIIGWLADHGGWGTPRLRIEFSIKLLHADASTPFRKFTPTEDFYRPDCDDVPFPVPRGGALEAEDGYACTTNGDCHLLVVHEATGKLYEMWRADITPRGFFGGCAVVWDLHKSYGNGRGQQCTSSDAGGFPVSAMLFTADEVASGAIDHAIRFILPNSRIRKGVYVWPATHASNALTGGPNAPPYGVRLRLRRDFPLQSLPTEGARVIARALMRHGMILSDGGHTPLTAADDKYTVHKWDEVGVDPDSVGNIRITDMEVVDMGKPVRSTSECERN